MFEIHVFCFGPNILLYADADTRIDHKITTGYDNELLYVLEMILNGLSNSNSLRHMIRDGIVSKMNRMIYDADADTRIDPKITSRPTTHRTKHHGVDTMLIK